MEQNKEKLAKFIDAVNADVDGKVSELMQEAQSEKSHILDEAAAEAARTYEKHIGEASKKIGNRCVREISKAELDAKKESLRRREELTDTLFNDVCSRLEEFRATPDYETYTIKAAAEAGAGKDSVIFLAPYDMSRSAAVGKAVGTEDIRQDSSIRLGGVSVLNSGSGIIIDRTFDTALKEQRKLFAAKNVLGGEASAAE